MTPPEEGVVCVCDMSTCCLLSSVEATGAVVPVGPRVSAAATRWISQTSLQGGQTTPDKFRQQHGALPPLRKLARPHLTPGRDRLRGEVETACGGFFVKF